MKLWLGGYSVAQYSDVAMQTPFVGLTGGIGSGKTQVANIFATCGVPVIDTDEAARQLTADNGLALVEIKKTFGADFFDINGHLDRAFLRAQVFASDAFRIQLEKILHPLILADVQNQMKETQAAYGILVVPLLFEKIEFASLVERYLVIDCDEQIQVQRVKQRSSLDEFTIAAIMAKQMPRPERLKLADDVIVNEAGLDELTQKVLAQHQFYLNLYE
jgi:dephospho-CoA kinase